jgi:hypothetical protein
VLVDNLAVLETDRQLARAFAQNSRKPFRFKAMLCCKF